MECVGEGLCPSRGRGRTPPLRMTRSAVSGASRTPPPTDTLKKCGGAGRCGHRPLRAHSSSAGADPSVRFADSLPTVVPTDSRPLSWPPIGALPRNCLASSVTGSAAAISPCAGEPLGAGVRWQILILSLYPLGGEKQEAGFVKISFTKGGKYCRIIPSVNKGRHGFDGQKCAHTASSPLEIRQVFPAGLSLSGHISAPQRRAGRRVCPCQPMV